MVFGPFFLAPSLPYSWVKPWRLPVRVAIPRMGETVAPCFEYCATMAIFTVADSGAVWQIDFPLRSREPLDRVRLLRDQRVDSLICGGMQAFYENMIEASGIQVIPWVSGIVEDLLALHLRGELVSGMELPWDCSSDFFPMDRMREH